MGLPIHTLKAVHGCEKRHRGVDILQLSNTTVNELMRGSGSRFVWPSMTSRYSVMPKQRDADTEWMPCASTRFEWVEALDAQQPSSHGQSEPCCPLLPSVSSSTWCTPRSSTGRDCEQVHTLYGDTLVLISATTESTSFGTTTLRSTRPYAKNSPRRGSRLTTKEVGSKR